jgi:hypothetical protein
MTDATSAMMVDFERLDAVSDLPHNKCESDSPELIAPYASISINLACLAGLHLRRPIRQIALLGRSDHHHQRRTGIDVSDDFWRDWPYWERSTRSTNPANATRE